MVMAMLVWGGGGVVVVSAWHVGIHVVQLLCLLQLTMIWMSVERGMRGVGGVCERCLAWACVGGEGLSENNESL